MRLRYKVWAIPELKENKYIYFDPEENKGKWKNIFENNHPIHLEIGGGRGSFAVEMAKRNPNINFISLEMDSNIFVYAARLFKDSNLNNLRGVRDFAQRSTAFFGNDEIDKIYINFCNPWPKKKQNKRRLTHPRFLNIYKQFLKVGGEIEFKTDNRPFFDDSIEYFENNGFEIIEKSYDLKQEDKPDNIITEYENKWRSQNIPINYLKVKLIDGSYEKTPEVKKDMGKW